MARNIEINFKSGENQYEVLYPVTLTGNIRDLESYLSSRYYSKSEIDNFNLQFGKMEFGILSLPTTSPRNRVLISSSSGQASIIKGMFFNIYLSGYLDNGRIGQERLVGFYLQGSDLTYGINVKDGYSEVSTIIIGQFEDYIYITANAISSNNGIISIGNGKVLLFY